MSRKQSREVVFRTIFALAFDVDDETELELASGLDVDKSVLINKDELNYINNLTSIVRENLEGIDKVIMETAKGFSFDRIYKVDLTALRVGIAEILYMEETPDIVAINEAVNLVKKYGTINSAGYINGILASVIENKRE